MPPFRGNLVSSAVGVAILAVAVSIVGNQWSKASDLRHRAEALTGGDAARGRALFVAKGCGGCHTLKGVTQADGQVGPPLDGIATRVMIAGKLANNPSNVVRWISSPQSVVPGNAMPNMPMTSQEADDLSAFLYTRT